MRFITEEYTNPLGVWVVREATRNSINSKPLIFGDKELMLTYARSLIRKKFGFDLDILLNQSQLLKNMKTQRKLFEF